MGKMKILPIFIRIWVWDLRVFSGVLVKCHGNPPDPCSGYQEVYLAGSKGAVRGKNTHTHLKCTEKTVKWNTL